MQRGGSEGSRPVRGPAIAAHATAITANATWGERALVLGCVLTAFFSAFHSIVDADIWFHLASGRWILEHGFPRLDPFSFPSAGREYVDLHWLFQVIAVSVYRAAGEPGLILSSCLTFTATTWLIYRQARWHSNASLAAPLTALAAVLMSERMSPRPELLSFLFLALTSWLVRRHREGWGAARWLIPALVVVWVNTEGLFVLAFLVLAAALLDAPGDRRLWITAGLCAAATLLNPWLLEGATHPLVLFTRVNRSLPLYSQTIAEFRSPFQDEPVYPAAWLFRYVYLPLLPLALIAGGKRIRFGELLLVAATTWLAVSARRNVALAPVLTMPVLARWLEEGWAWRTVKERWLGSGRVCGRRGVASFLPHAANAFTGLLVLGYLLGLATNRIYAHAETNRRFGLARAPVAFAREAARFVDEEGVAGPLFSTLSAGSYFTWAVPREKVFIDGRLEVHTAEHYERYLRLRDGGPVWAQADRRFRFNAAVVQYMDAMGLALERLRDPAWAPVHIDDTAIVFLRRNERNAALIARRRVTPEKLAERFPSSGGETSIEKALPRPPPALARLLTPVRFPWSRVNLAQLFLGLGRPDLAVPQLVEAVREAPGIGPPRVLLAAALNALGQPEQALRVLQSAARLGGSRGARARASAVHGDILERLGARGHGRPR